MNEQLQPVYNPSTVENTVYDLWEKGGYFNADPDPNKKPYTIVIPPPNVTGALHMGHALNNVLQDILIRLNRMRGRAALWIPGTDHAATATQAVVEKRLFEEEHKTRHDIGREALVARIWAWKDEYEQRILQQLKQMGCSCDWRRTRFTMDELCSRAVRQTFFSFFRDGLIYRGKRLVNWDTHLQTAISDDEVYHKSVEGYMWHIKYPIADGSGHLTVATTRPETMLGDTAVAVHPEDPRYKKLIGKMCILPLLNRQIPIIADAKLVDMDFGSGCVKVTPAHDANDYDCGLRNNLPMINILNPDGTLNQNGGPYAGLDRYAAREKIVADLQADGLIEKIEPYTVEIGHSDRSKTPIEPYLSDQWFVRMAELAQKAIDAVEDGRVRFYPPRYARTYIDWLSEKRDWCISRQLWFGHRIPIWYCSDCDEQTLRCAFASRDDICWRRDLDADRWLICSLREDLPPDVVEGAHLQQDPDVLDTWFSSALWPHSTLGWPEQTDELKYFYPTDVLVTSRDIITLWVARMVITGLYNTGKVPFRHVYIHSKILDGQGRTMSKSLGNGVDPLDIIANYGADAMRMTLALMATETQDVRMPVKVDSAGRNTSEKFEIGRNFCNKLWNATRFALMNLRRMSFEPLRREQLLIQDRWILSRLQQATEQVATLLDGYRFSEAANTLYRFFWSELCDWYLEMIKPRLRSDADRPTAQRVLAVCIDGLLRLLHPFVPFITERLWSKLNEIAPQRGLEVPLRTDRPLIVSPWPQPHPELRDSNAEQLLQQTQQIIRAIRDIRTKYKISPGRFLDVVLVGPNHQPGRLPELGEVISHMAKVNLIQQPSKPADAVTAMVEQVQVCVLGVLDRQAELARLGKEKQRLEQRIAAAEARLANGNFLAKAPARVVRQHRENLQQLREKLDAVNRSIAELQAPRGDD